MVTTTAQETFNMALRFVGCAAAQAFWPRLVRRCSQHATGLAESASRSSDLGRPTDYGRRPLRRLGRTAPAAWRDEPLARSYSSTRLPDVYTAPPHPLARETPPVGRDANTLVDVQVDLKGRLLSVSWKGGSAKSQAYPFVWLRDNCLCPLCFHPAALERHQDAHLHLEVEVMADAVEISPEGKSVVVQWDDGHKSEFRSDWLRYYRFDQSPVEQLLNPKRALWGADVNVKCFGFDELLAEDHALYDWLAELVTRGIAVVKDAPAEVGQLHKVAKRVAFLRPTIYGITFHSVSTSDPTTIAFTSEDLAMHTDYTYFVRMPEVLMLHCIEQAAGQGGDSLLVDAVKVALDLKNTDPTAFRLLTTYQFEYLNKGREDFGDFHMHSRHPVIKLDEVGDIEQIAISNHSRDPMLRAPVDQILPIYRALDTFCRMLQLPENRLQYKLQKGDILTIDNRRVLHGRSSFQVTESNVRHLEGGYLEWDEINSRLRTLARQLQERSTGE